MASAGGQAPRGRWREAWKRPEGRKTCFVGTVTALGFEFVP